MNIKVNYENFKLQLLASAHTDTSELDSNNVLYKNKVIGQVVSY